MAVSLLKQRAETERQNDTGDNRFYKQWPWVFRIVVDGFNNVGVVGDDGTATFTLPMAPTTFRYSLPFSVELTPQQEGGIIAEEEGIVIGEMEIEGTTGFNLKPPKISKHKPAKGTFTGILAENVNVVKLPVSGQLLFYILANQMIEGYSQLKKDPLTSAATRLELHIFKDQIHVQVIPKVFVLERIASQDKINYYYRMQLDVVGPAAPVVLTTDTEKRLLDKIQDGINEVRGAVQGATAVIQDLNAYVDELDRILNSASSIISDAASVIDAASEFLDGVVDLINVPIYFIQNVTGLIESGAQFLEDVTDIPADVVAAMRSLGDEFDRMTVAGANFFNPSFDAEAQRYSEDTKQGSAVEPSDDPVNEQVRAAQEQKYQRALDLNGRMTIEEAYSGASRPGDTLRAVSYEDRIKPLRANGYREVVINGADTLETLAARYLSDASRWLEIAIINQLDPPYITKSANIPRTLRRGDKILIPTTTREGQDALVTKFSPKERSSQQVELLGREFKLVPADKQKRLAWAVDTAKGSVDIKTVEGVDCFAQGIRVRLETNRGEDITNISFGVPKAVGRNNLLDTTSATIFGIREELLNDPRTEEVRNFDYDQQVDAIEITAEVVPKGFSTPTIIKKRIR